jgi:hypothetical protein
MQMRPKIVLAFTITLILILLVSTAATLYSLQSKNSSPECFVGVEFAYSSNLSDLKALVDQVKNYTNLFAIGSLDISANEAVLDEAADYVVDAGLHLVVFFTDSTKYNYTIFDWMTTAQQKYGDMFLGVYRFDEVGGNQLDNGPSMLVKNATSYADAAAQFTDSLGIIVNYYLNYTPRMFTADYASTGSTTTRGTARCLASSDGTTAAPSKLRFAEAPQPPTTETGAP